MKISKYKNYVCFSCAEGNLTAFGLCRSKANKLKLKSLKLTTSAELNVFDLIASKNRINNENDAKNLKFNI